MVTGYDSDAGGDRSVMHSKELVANTIKHNLAISEAD